MLNFASRLNGKKVFVLFFVDSSGGACADMHTPTLSGVSAQRRICPQIRDIAACLRAAHNGGLVGLLA